MCLVYAYLVHREDGPSHAPALVLLVIVCLFAGEYAKLRALVVHHIYACKLIGLSTLGLQILALMVSCSLYYAENTPRYEYRAVAMEPQDYETASQISVQVCKTALI